MVKVQMKWTLLIITEQAPHHAKVQDHRAKQMGLLTIPSQAMAEQQRIHRGS